MIKQQRQVIRSVCALVTIELDRQAPLAGRQVAERWGRGSDAKNMYNKHHTLPRWPVLLCTTAAMTTLVCHVDGKGTLPLTGCLCAVYVGWPPLV